MHGYTDAIYVGENGGNISFGDGYAYGLTKSGISYFGTGHIYIGNPDIAVSTSLPSIKGLTYGIYNSTGGIDLRNGFLAGTTGVYLNGPIAPRSGYTIKNSSVAGEDEFGNSVLWKKVYLGI